MEQLKEFKTEIFRAMAHPTRVHILDTLRKGEHSVMELCEHIGLQHSNISQQLSILRNRNLVSTRKDGNIVYYSIKDKAVFKLLDVTKEIIENQFQNLQTQFKQGKNALAAVFISAIETMTYLAETMEVVPLELCS